jgi:para-nitrobenzyl esterase
MDPRPAPHDRPAACRNDDGPVRGLLAGDHRTFEGIPYAAPPVGPLRWASPRRPTPWTAPLAATEPGSPCAQTGGFPGDPPSDTEDCPYLNVTTPARTDGRKLPVMVWIHGDGERVAPMHQSREAHPLGAAAPLPKGG